MHEHRSCDCTKLLCRRDSAPSRPVIWYAGPCLMRPRTERDRTPTAHRRAYRMLGSASVE